MKNLAIIATAVAAVFISGCEMTSPRVRPSFDVSVDGLAAQVTNSAVSFIILSGDTNVATSDLQFQEFAAIVERALSRRNLQRAASLEEADMAIFLAYGIGEPKEHVYSYLLPHFGQTGVSSSSTYGVVNGNSYSGTTYYNPTYGVTGYSSMIGTRVTRTRHIFVEALDLPVYRKQNKVVQLWKTTIVSVGPSDDLRRAFPVMIGASLSYIGTNTGRIRRVEIYEDDPRVLFVKGIPADQKK